MSFLHQFTIVVVHQLPTFHFISATIRRTWGFGAKYSGEVRHIFQCGSTPTATGIDGVLNAYRSVFETDLTMSGPTNFLSVLKADAARAKKYYNAATTTTTTSSNNNKSLNYCILLILTDGMVNDLESTQDFIRAYKDLPLSIIVVGIGRADFTEMHRWSNTASSNIRGGFAFVEFRECEYDPLELSRKAMERVPHDVREYFLGSNMLPR